MTDAPIPLVTMTLTTDEIAKAQAGLNLLRRFHAARAMQIGAMGDDNRESLAIVEECTDFINRLESSVTQEQGADLLRLYLKNRGRQS